MNRDELDTARLKEFCDGKLGGVNIMYGNSREMELQCKLYVTTNHLPKFRTDKGIERRGLVMELVNRYLPELKYKQAVDNKEKNVYLADTNLLNIFDDDSYKLALIHLLLPYAKKYYEQGLAVSEMQQAFEDLCIDSDKYMQLKLDHLRITNDDNDRLTKGDLADLFESGIQDQDIRADCYV